MSKMSFEEIKQQSLALTSLFETSQSAPDCFGRVAGNFDDAGLSFGAIQFNFLWQTVNPIFEGMINNHPDVTKQAWNFNQDPSYYNTFVDVVLNRTKDEQVAWGDSISDPNNKHNVLEPWRTFFYNMGITQECIDLQIDATQWYFDQAMNFFEYFSFYSRRAYALCFDIAVQNGSISETVKQQVWSDMDKVDTTTLTREEIETELMVILANRRAEAVNSQWIEVVRERKLAIAYGSGWVHGGTLFADTEAYGLTLASFYPEEEVPEYNPFDFPSRTDDHLFGIDVSEYQGDIDYQKVKDSGVKYVILRAYGSLHTNGGDTRAAEYYQGFKNVGIPCGSYFYAWIDNVNDFSSARKQADLYADKLEEIFGEGNFGDLMPFMDLETNQSVIDQGFRIPTSGVSHDNLDTTAMLKWADEFRQHFEERTQRRLGLYTAHYFVQEHNNFNEGVTSEGNVLKDMPVWIAAFDKYGYSQPLESVGGWQEWLMYQYSEDGNGSEHGVSSATVDLNRSKPIEWLRPPSPVTNFTAQPSIDGNMNLSWTISEDEDILHYHIFVDGDWKTVVSSKTQSYVVYDLVAEQEYYFWILAQDKYGETSRSNVVIKNMTVDENAAPLTPTGLKAIASDNKVILSWNKNADEIHGYNIYVNGEWYKFTSQTTDQVIGLENEIEYGFQIDADYGSKSLKTDFIYSTPTENIPYVPSDLEVDILSNKDVKLSWKTPTINLLDRGFDSFETFSEGALEGAYSTVHTTTLDVVTDRSYVGEKSLLFEGSSTNNWFYLSENGEDFHIPVKANQKYMLSFYVYCESPATIRGRVRHSNGGAHFGDLYTIPANSWTRMYYSFIPNEDGMIFTGALVEEANVPVYFDGFLLEASQPNQSTPSTYKDSPLESFSHFEIHKNGNLFIDNIHTKEQTFSIAEYNVEQEVKVIAVDGNDRRSTSESLFFTVQVPDAPTNVQATPLDRAVHVTWDEYEENWVTGFNVFDENWNYLTTVSRNEATITGLENGVEYSFMIQAFTGEEITSAISAIVYSTPVIEFPNPPENFEVSLNSNRSVTLTWDHVPLEAFSHFRITRNGVVILDNITDTTTIISDLELNVSHEFIVYSVDAQGDESKSRNVTIKLNVPLPLTNVVAISGDSEITLTWTKSEEEFVEDYDVFMNGEFLRNVQSTETVIRNLNNGTEYSFEVYPISDQGYSSDSAITVTGQPYDTYPNIPVNVIAKATKDKELRLSWEHNQKHNFSHYRIMVNGSLHKDDVTKKEYFLKNIEYNADLIINVVAVDTNERETWSEDVTARINVPAAPTGLVAEGKNREVVLSWNANEEDFVVGYGLYERGSWYDFVSGTSITVPFKTNNIEYSYQVVAITDQEIFSDKSEEVTATPRLILPSVPEITNHDELGSGEATIYWNHEQDEYFSHYKIFLNGSQIGNNLTDTSYTTNILERNVSHIINVEAINTFGDTSGWSENYSFVVYAETLDTGTDLGLNLGEIDLNKKPIKPEIFLCQPNFKTVAKLSEAYNINQNTRLADTNEINFEIAYNIEKNREIVRNPHVDQIRERFLLRVELGDKKEYYVITRTNDISDNDADSKEVTAFSLGYELRDFIIQNYDEMPRSLKEHCRDVLRETIWSLGIVDFEISQKNRPFSANNKTLLEVIQDLAETYEAVIQWDTINRIIHFRDIEKIGVNKGLKLSYGKYLTNIGKESKADDMVTQLIPRGKEDLTIRSVMPTGADYIESFDYFIYPFERDENGNVIKSSHYMSDGLAGALVDYKEFIENAENNFAFLNDRKKKLEDELFREQSKLLELEYELITVEGVVNAFKATDTLFYFKRTFTGTRITIDQPLKHEYNYAVMAKVSDANNIRLRLDGEEKIVHSNEWVLLGKVQKGTTDDHIATSVVIDGGANNVEVEILITEIRQTEFDEENNEYELIRKYNEDYLEMLIKNQEDVVNDIEEETDELEGEIEQLKEDLKLENFFTEEQLIERNHYIIQRTWENENITNAEELRVEAEKEFRNLQEPSVVIKTSIVNLLEIVEEQRNWNKLKLGDVLTVHHERIGIDIKAKIVEIDYNYEQGEITLTITNLKDIKSDKENFLSALYGAISTSSSVNSDRYKWDQSVQTARDVEDFMNKAFDATKQTIIAGTNNSIEISRRGLLIRDLDDPDNFLIGQHKVLAITNDGGKSYKNAITTSGVVGERIYGRILAGVNLIIENVGGTFKVDENGVVIDGSALQIIGGIGDENLNIDRSGQTAFMENYSEANDKIAVPPSLPEISTLGDAIQHTINTDGSANISFEWQFVDDDLDENNIDGFIVYVYQSSSSAEYAFGTNEINEFSYNVTPRKRSITIYSLPADRYYSFGVKAYRMVDEEVNVDGYLETAIVTVDLAQQNPYKPTLFIPYDGDIKGTINEYTNVDIRDQSFNSVLLGHSYNNISIDINSGLVATKDNDLVRTIMNATDGIKIQTRESTDVSYVDVFYVDTTGQLVAEGMKAKSLQIEDKNGNLLIDAREGVFNLDFLNSINGTFPEGSLVIGSETIFKSGYDPKDLAATGMHVLADTPNGIDDDGAYHSNAAGYGLHLSNETTINITYVTMYAQLDTLGVMATGKIQLIRKDTGEIVESKDVFLEEGYNRILLNFMLREDVGEYFLHVDGEWVGGSVYRNTDFITAFPYTSGSFTINSGGTYTTTNNFYYYFYDIAISGERVEGTFINDKTLEKWKVDENGETKIDGGQILTRSIEAEKIAVGTLTSELISTEGLNAEVIKTGTLDANQVTVRADFSGGSFVRLDSLGLRAYDGVKDTFKINTDGSATFSGEIVGGSITSNTSIVVSTDVRVGRNLYLGYGFSSGTTNYLRVSSGATISGSGLGNMYVSANSFNVNDGDTVLGGDIYHITEQQWISSGREEGFCGIGGRNNNFSEGTSIVGTAVNFKRKRAVTPTGCSFTTSSSNKGASITDYDKNGFWIYMNVGTSPTGYYYWRGTYVVQD